MRSFSKFGRLTIRMQLRGCVNRPFFHIVAAPQKYRLDIEPLETIGSYDPMPNDNSEVLLAVNVERLRYWLGKGAYITRGTGELLGLAGIMPIHSFTLVKAWKARKNLLEAQEPKEEETPTS